jgi:hypothetical protein
MGSGDVVGIADLRVAVADQVANRSLRAVAREIGMSAPGLRSFLEGGEPFEATRKKLLRWYLALDRLPSKEPSAELAAEALSALLAHLRVTKRAEVRAGVIRLIEVATSSARVRKPSWMRRQN